MKKAAYVIVVFAIIMGIFAPVFADSTPYNHEIKKLYSAPGTESKIVYDIPLEVKLLDVSEDANWYKVKIQFYLGPACFKYSGWTYIPVGKILAEREAAKITAKN